MALSVTQTIVRGATVKFTTTFYDAAGAVAQPDSATINLAYENTDGVSETEQVAMTAPNDPTTDPTWTALWDSRGVQAPRTVFWSIHTGTNDPIPVAVEDGQFQLLANPANLPTF